MQNAIALPALLVLLQVLRARSSSVWSVERRSISDTPIKLGLLSSITQPKGEIDVSQAVNAKRASMVLSGETLGGSTIFISTAAAVLSSIFLILIFPFFVCL